MANPYKGEARWEIGNVIYTLVFSVNTIIEIEEKLGKGFIKIGLDLQDPEKVSYTVLRIMLWAALREKHKEISWQEAAEIFIGGGGLAPVMKKVLEAFAAAFPTQKKDDAARPTAPSQIVGTGSASFIIVCGFGLDEH